MVHGMGWNQCFPDFNTTAIKVCKLRGISEPVLEEKEIAQLDVIVQNVEPFVLEAKALGNLD